MSKPKTISLGYDVYTSYVINEPITHQESTPSSLTTGITTAPHIEANQLLANPLRS